MKRFFFILVLSAISLITTNVNAQEGSKSILIKMGYQTSYDRFGIGLEGRHFFTDHFRFAPEITYFFPSDDVKGLDINANLHYLFSVDDEINLYPLVGIGMINNRWSKGDVSHGDTDFGFNLGLGMEYYVSSNSFFNGEFKYSIQNKNNAILMVGYGIRF